MICLLDPTNFERILSWLLFFFSSRCFHPVPWPPSIPPSLWFIDSSVQRCPKNHSETVLKCPRDLLAFFSSKKSPKISKNLQKIENFKESWRILKNIWKWVKIWINKGLKNLLEDWKRPAANSHRCVVRCHWIYSGFYYDNKNSCYDSCFVFILMMIIIIIKMNGRVDELILRFVSAGKTPE